MHSTTVPPSAADLQVPPARRGSLWRRVFGVAVEPRTYRHIAYLLLGFVLATVWFTVLVSLLSVSVSLLIVALLGLPLLLGTWYVVRAFANVERAVANALLDQRIALAPMASGCRGNLWVRLKAMTRERNRWRELGFLLLRIPVGVATFTAAVVALTVPVVVAWAPVQARRVEEPFGDWFWSSELQDAVAGSPWSWLLVPAGLGLLLAALHLLSSMASACGRWAADWL